MSDCFKYNPFKEFHRIYIIFYLEKGRLPVSTKVVAGQLHDRRDQEINWLKSVVLIQ